MEYYSDYLALRTDIIQWIQKRLKPSRFQHTLGVEQAAVSMARLYGEDQQNASIAALLHDNAKNLPIETQLEICRLNYPKELCLTMDFASVLHAFAGAPEAKLRYPGLSDSILNAIRYHTTGRPAMTKLDKIIYCADYIEPNRQPFDGLEEARKTLMKNLDDGFWLILNQTNDYVEDRHKPVHPLTRMTIDFYKSQFQ